MKRSIEWIIGMACAATMPLWSASPLRAASPRGATENGNALYRQGEYAGARDLYLAAQADRPDARELDFNIGDTFYEEGDPERAITAFSTVAADTSVDTALRAGASYNLGNALFRAGQIDRAIEAYRQALRLDPTDVDAKHNLELATKKKNEEPKDQDEQEKQNKEEKEEGKDNQERDKSKEKREPDSTSNQDSDEEKSPEENEPQGEEQSPEPQNEEPKEDGEPQSEGGMSRADALRILQALEAQEMEQAREQERRALLRAMAASEAKDW